VLEGQDTRWYHLEMSLACECGVEIWLSCHVVMMVYLALKHLVIQIST
jgi:hypothetical protein